MPHSQDPCLASNPVPSPSIPVLGEVGLDIDKRITSICKHAHNRTSKSSLHHVIRKASRATASSLFKDTSTDTGHSESDLLKPGLAIIKYGST